MAVTSRSRRLPTLVLATLAAAAIASGACCGASRQEPPAQGQQPQQSGKQPEQAPEAPKVLVPKAWDPSPEEIASAPETLRERGDEYTVRFLPGPSRSMLARKAEIYRLAHAYFKGTEQLRKSAKDALIRAGLPAASWLVELAGLIVPKAERPAPDPDSYEPYETPEDVALDVVKEIMVAVLQKGEVDPAMEFFAIATHKTIELDAELAGKKHQFRVHKVHPIPALFTVGDSLGCDMQVVDHNLPVITLMLPVLLDMKVHGEDSRWLLENLARLGRFKAELADDVRGPVSFRIRARDFAEAFKSLCTRAGFKAEPVEGGFRVKGKA